MTWENAGMSPCDDRVWSVADKPLTRTLKARRLGPSIASVQGRRIGFEATPYGMRSVPQV